MEEGLWVAVLGCALQLVGPEWPTRALSRPCGGEAQGDPKCHDPLAWGWSPLSLACGMRLKSRVTLLRHTRFGGKMDTSCGEIRERDLGRGQV